MNDIREKIGFPMYVKPANLGSSIGITCVREEAALADALALALSYDRRVVAEKAVPNAVEINCSVLGYGRGLPGQLVRETGGLAGVPHL